MNLKRILCLTGRHVRSRGQARRTADGWRSRCRRCGAAMVKADGGEWMLADREPAAEDAGRVRPARRKLFRRRARKEATAD